MIFLTSPTLFFLESLLFASVLLMHLVKRNTSIVFLYMAQSFIVVFALFFSFLKEAAIPLLIVVLATFVVKIIVAPYFFFNLIKKHRLYFEVSTYLNVPITLIVLVLLFAFSNNFLAVFTTISETNQQSLVIAFAMMLVSLFLIINRKGALSQMAGILSLENSIVSFAYIADLEATGGPQIGILFDIAVWIVIAAIFASMVYRHFGSLDVSAMHHLKEE